MAKIHPTVGEGERRLDGRKGIKDFAKDLIERASRWEEDRALWIENKLIAYARRYASSNFAKPDVSFPWLGASNFDFPLSDIHIEELKPPLMNLHLGGPLVYNMVPMNANGIPNAPQAARTMDSILKYRMPDYPLQILWGSDSLAMYGTKTDKVYYSYVTRQQDETIRRIDLPPRLANIAVFADLTPQQQQIANQIGVQLLTRAQFDENAKQIQAIVEEEYDLDPDERVDKLAIEEVMRFLRNGSSDSELIIKRRAVVEDTPRLINVPLEDILTPSGTTNIADAEGVVHWMFFSESDIKQRARDNVWDDNGVRAVLNSGGARDRSGFAGSAADVLYQAKMDRLRLANMLPGDTEDSLFRIGEFYTKWDIDGDGLDERIVITMDPKSGTILKAIPLPFDHGEWPFTDTFLEATDQDRLAPRGIPEQIHDLESHATALGRAEENNLLIETSRSFTYIDTSSINPMTLNWMPNLMIPVQSHDDLKAIEMAPRALALEQPMRNLLALAERRVSGANRAVLDLPPPERRTATEVQSFSQARQQVMTVRAILYNEGAKRNGKLIWSLWKQYGPDSWYTFITGEDPVKLTQAQIQGEFMAQPVGAVADMDPDFRAQQALQRLQISMNLHSLIVDDPRWTHDLAQAYADWLNQMDPLTAQRILRPNPPEEIQRRIQSQQAQAQRLSQFAELAQMAKANTPMTEDKMEALISEMKKNMPHGALQQILEASQQADRRSEANAALIGANGQ
jgi:hypothetical protein